VCEYSVPAPDGGTALAIQAGDYLTETAFTDLRDLALDTRDGLHLAGLVGAWLAAVAGFGGMRDHGKTLSFAPRLPSRLTRLSFGLLYRGRRLHVDVVGDAAQIRAARRQAAGDPPPRRKPHRDRRLPPGPAAASHPPASGAPPAAGTVAKLRPRLNRQSVPANLAPSALRQT